MKLLPQIKIDAPPINWQGLNHRYMNNGELEVLCAIMGSVMPRTVIEFGINSGRTAKALLREITTIKKYIGVDVLPGYMPPMRAQ